MKRTKNNDNVSKYNKNTDHFKEIILGQFV